MINKKIKILSINKQVFLTCDHIFDLMQNLEDKEIFFLIFVQNFKVVFF